MEKEERVSFFKNIIRQGFKDPKIGVSILRKLVPDKVFSELEFSGEGIVRKVEFQLVDTPEDIPKKPKKVVSELLST